MFSANMVHFFKERMTKKTFRVSDGVVHKYMNWFCALFCFLQLIIGYALFTLVKVCPGRHPVLKQ